MLARNSLIAIFALSAGYSLMQGMQSPAPAGPASPAAQGSLRQAPVRVLFDPPTPKPVARQLQQGAVHIYPLPLKAGELVTVIAYQDGVDLKVTASGPDGKPFLTMNSPNGNMGPERLLFVADATATYRVEISGTSERDSGPYRIWLVAEHLATKRDREDAAAEILFFQAKAKGKAGEKELLEAAALWKQARNPVRRADAFVALGQLYVVDPREWKKALPVWRQAKALYHGAREFGIEGRTDASIGLAYNNHSFAELAKKSYQKALLEGRRGNNSRVVAAALYSLGTILRQQGRVVDALEMLDQAKTAGKGLGPQQEAKPLIAMGEIFTDVGNFRLARAEFQDALRILEQQEDLRIKAFLYVGMARLYSKLHEQAQARRFYLEALQIQRQIKSVNDTPTSLNGIASTYLSEEKAQDAVVFFQEALDLAQRENNPLEQAAVLTNLGEAYSLLNREKDARSAYEQALALARGKDAQAEAIALLGLTYLEVASGNPIAAQKQAEAAVKCVESMRALVGRDLQVRFFATRQDVYEALIDVLLWEDRLHPSEGYDAQALRVSEQARSRSLLDSVSSFRLKTDHGAAHSAELPIPAILSLSEIQSSILDSDTLLLEYHLGRSASYLWVVGKDFHQIFQLPARQQIEDLARKVSKLFSSSSQLYQARQAAEDLSRMVLGPAAYWLGEKRLVISSPAILQAVPFGALPDPQGSPSAGDDESWPSPLCVKHEIIRIPSASVVGAIRARAVGRRPPPNRLAVLSDPVSSDRDDRLTGRPGTSPATRSQSAIDSLYGGFDRLEHSKEEADAILAEAGSRGVWSASGFDVTRKLVLGGQLSSFRIIHFSMHALFVEDDGDQSALVLSLWDHHRHYRNEFLHASEIYGLKLPADLIVLSACNTGRGENVPGEGVIGLSQAFLVAGATQVMMSLWTIDDSATSTLMKKFYHEYLAKGAAPAAALREAERMMLRGSNKKAPFYWGGFEIQGDWNLTSVRR
jgi:CHAT domain-containing protein/Tfp pilus assembly protein PilF